MSRSSEGRAHGSPVVAALAISVSALLFACGPTIRPEAHFANERSFLRLGVELEEEDAAVRRVLAQRRLSVVSEVRGPFFIALGAVTYDERLSAIRVISPRGVIVAEDAAQDDLFAPASLQLLEHFPATLGEYHLVAWSRAARGRELGCVSLTRLLPDGSPVSAILDVGEFGPRACVADLRASGERRLRALLAFPGLFSGQTPSLFVELAFQAVPIGREAPRVPVAKIVQDGTWLEAERARVEASARADAGFEERQALGVARAAIALLAGLEREAQVAAYRSTVGRVMPGSEEAAVVVDTLDYLERGWADHWTEETPEGKRQTQIEEGDVVISPDPWAHDGGLEAADEPEDEPADDALIIEPPKKQR